MRVCWRVFILAVLLAVPMVAQTKTPCAPRKHFSLENVPLKYDFTAEIGKESSANIANNYSAALTGLVSELTMADGTTRAFVWDAYDRNMEPGAPGGTTIQSFPPARGGLPKAKLVAAIWADGSTYGDEASVERILASRKVIAAGYKRLAKTLADGMQKKWTREQYLAAIEEDEQKAAAEPQSPELHRAAILPHGALRGMLNGGVVVKGKPASLGTAVRKAIAYCEEEQEQMSVARCQ